VGVLAHLLEVVVGPIRSGGLHTELLERVDVVADAVGALGDRAAVELALEHALVQKELVEGVGL
jgi:hypothetical protein